MKMNRLKTVTMVSVALGFIATIMIFFPSLAFPNSDSSFLGFEVALGKEFVDLGSFASGKIAFNLLTILAFLLPISASVVLLFASKRTETISTILFGVSVLLLLLIPTYTVTTVTVFGNTNAVDIDWTYSYGLIIAIVCSIGGLIISSYNLLPRSTKIL